MKTDPELTPAYLASAMLSFNEQLEHMFEVVVVLLAGAALMIAGLTLEGFGLAALLLFLVRPLSALPVWSTKQFTAGAIYQYRLVRHAGHRIDLLPSFCHQPRSSRKVGSAAVIADFVRGRSLNRVKWRIGDPIVVGSPPVQPPEN